MLIQWLHSLILVYCILLQNWHNIKKLETDHQSDSLERRAPMLLSQPTEAVNGIIQWCTLWYREQLKNVLQQQESLCHFQCNKKWPAWYPESAFKLFTDNILYSTAKKVESLAKRCTCLIVCCIPDVCVVKCWMQSPSNSDLLHLRQTTFITATDQAGKRHDQTAHSTCIELLKFVLFLYSGLNMQKVFIKFTKTTSTTYRGQCMHCPL